VCYPLTELSVIRHEPDNRFLECALAADAEFIVTVNTAPGHFDRKQYQSVNVARPSESSVDSSKPAINRRFKTLHFWRAIETRGVLLRALLRAQVGVDLGAPAPWAALEHVRVM
jgi:hypothetical protein